jgi:hypothetical protein
VSNYIGVVHTSRVGVDIYVSLGGPDPVASAT